MRIQVSPRKRLGCKGAAHSRGLPGNWDEEVVKVMGGGVRGGVGLEEMKVLERRRRE